MLEYNSNLYEVREQYRSLQKCISKTLREEDEQNEEILETRIGTLNYRIIFGRDMAADLESESLQKQEL